MDLVGGIEAGGTKFVCAVADATGTIQDEERIPTTAPPETLERAIAFFEGRGVAAIGIGSFGPLDLRAGKITTTPKPGWSDCAIRDVVARALSVPVVLDTDVNAAALAEHAWGAARDVDNFIYLTIGTGIGGGAIVHGSLLHGLVHPEMGHVRIPWDAREFAGICPYHGDCLEGVASGPALRARWGRPAEELPPDHPGWPIEARALALGVANFICTLSPERVVVGGGVMETPGLLARVRVEVRRALNGYVPSPALGAEIDRFIVPPALGARAGVRGAIALARTALARP